MFSLDPYREAITRLCRQLRVQRLDLVGSAARDDFRPESDVDVLVTFISTDHLFDRYFTLKEGLEALFRRPVDVIMEEAITNPLVRQSLQQDRRGVYAPCPAGDSVGYSALRAVHSARDPEFVRIGVYG